MLNRPVFLEEKEGEVEDEEKIECSEERVVVEMVDNISVMVTMNVETEYRTFCPDSLECVEEWTKHLRCF